jgi:uncharacterized membrane protein
LAAIFLSLQRYNAVNKRKKTMVYKDILQLIYYAINSCSALVLVYGVIRCLLGFVYIEVQGLSIANKLGKRQEVLAYMGSYILFSLEFLVAADIIKTLADPSLQEVLILGAVVLLRTFIAYFLGKEVSLHANQQTKKEVSEASCP